MVWGEPSTKLQDIGTFWRLPGSIPGPSAVTLEVGHFQLTSEPKASKDGLVSSAVAQEGLPNAKGFPFPFSMQLLNKAEKREAGLPPDPMFSNSRCRGGGTRVPQLSLPNHTNASFETSLSCLVTPQQTPIQLVQCLAPANLDPDFFLPGPRFKGLETLG